MERDIYTVYNSLSREKVESGDLIGAILHEVDGKVAKQCIWRVTGDGLNLSGK